MENILTGSFLCTSRRTSLFSPFVTWPNISGWLELATNLTQRNIVATGILTLTFWLQLSDQNWYRCHFQGIFWLFWLEQQWKDQLWLFAGFPILFRKPSSSTFIIVVVATVTIDLIVLRERCVERASILQTLRYIVISSSSLSSYNCPQKCLFNVLFISKYPHRGQQPTYVNDFCHFVMILTIVFLGSKMVSRFLT